MSLLLYSKIPGTQVKRDANLSNATVQCDPTLLFPQGATQGGVPLNKENLAGKIAVDPVFVLDQTLIQNNIGCETARKSIVESSSNFFEAISK